VPGLIINAQADLRKAFYRPNNWKDLPIEFQDKGGSTEPLSMVVLNGSVLPP